MITRAAIIAAARRWVGTPYVHQGRARGAGVDCIGVVIGVAHELGLSAFDFRAYDRVPHEPTMRELLDEHMMRIPAPRPGSVIALRFTRPMQHVGIVTDGGRFVHAYARRERCIETQIGSWTRRIVAVYDYRGVEAWGS